MASLRYIKDKLGALVYPITHFRAVRDDNGVDLETTLNTYTKQSYVDGDYYSE